MSGKIIKTYTVVLAPLTEDHLSMPTFKPAALIDGLRERMGLANDLKLAYALQIPHATISKLRKRRAPVSAAILLRMHDVTGLPVNDLREMAGIELPNFD